MSNINILAIFFGIYVIASSLAMIRIWMDVKLNIEEIERAFEGINKLRREIIEWKQKK